MTAKLQFVVAVPSFAGDVLYAELHELAAGVYREASVLATELAAQIQHEASELAAEVHRKAS